MRLLLQRSPLDAHDALVRQALKAHQFQTVVTQSDQPDLQQARSCQKLRAKHLCQRLQALVLGSSCHGASRQRQAARQRGQHGGIAAQLHKAGLQV